MKTAGDYVDEIHGVGDLPEDVKAIIVKSYKNYAREVAKKALKGAAKNAHIIEVPFDHLPLGFTQKVVNKRSILNTEIITP